MRTHVTLFATLFTIGCGGQIAAPGLQAPVAGDDDAPLSSYAAVFRGAPPNGSLPIYGRLDATYPPKYTDLVALQSPVKNQAHRGVCTIFSSVALMEHLYKKAGAPDLRFSEQYLQWAVKVQLGAFADSEGSSNDENLAAVAQYGIVEESLDPYNPNEWGAADDAACKPDGSEDQTLPTKCWTQGDPPAAAVAAKKWTLPEGRYLSTADIKSHMTSNGSAVAIGLDFFYQAWNHGASTLPINRDDYAMGIVRFPNADDVTASHKQRAGHGVVLVGWDDTLAFPTVDGKGNVVKDAAGNPVLETGFYIFKNSWGTTRFGASNPYGAGYGYISQRYVNQYASAFVTDAPTLDAPPTP